MLPDFFFCSLFPVQQTTSGIGHRVKYFFGLATNTLNVRNNNNNNNNNMFRELSESVDIFVIEKRNRIYFRFIEDQEARDFRN